MYFFDLFLCLAQGKSKLEHIGHIYIYMYIYIYLAKLIYIYVFL